MEAFNAKNARASKKNRDASIRHRNLEWPAHKDASKNCEFITHTVVGGLRNRGKALTALCIRVITVVVHVQYLMQTSGIAVQKVRMCAETMHKQQQQLKI